MTFSRIRIKYLPVIRIRSLDAAGNSPGSENHNEIIKVTMGSLKKRRKAKINKHKRSKRMRQNRHKKRLRYKS